MKQAGGELRKRRVSLGMSRLDVYRRHRIPVTFIAAMEDARLDDLPATIYARGFLRSYCEALGFSHEPFVDVLDDALRKPQRFFGMAAPVFARPAWMRDALMWAAVLGVVVFGWTAYSLVFEPGENGARNQVRADILELRVADPFGAE